MFYGVVEKNYDKKSKTEKISFGVKLYSLEIFTKYQM